MGCCMIFFLTHCYFVKREMPYTSHWNAKLDTSKIIELFWCQIHISYGGYGPAYFLGCVDGKGSPIRKGKFDLMHLLVRYYFVLKYCLNYHARSSPLNHDLSMIFLALVCDVHLT